MTPVCSIIIPCHPMHYGVLPEAVAAALTQTAPVEVIVVHDGPPSPAVIPRVAFIDMVSQAGPSACRNAGIDAASAEYIMFLDADDVIAPHKVERQIAELEAHPDAGWCFCDTRIIDEVARKDELASKRYDYASMRLNGNIEPLLRERNFLPVHAPLIWRPALCGLRFEEQPLEDWAFWRALAALATVRYIPQVLATYRAGKGGRNRSSPKAACSS